MIDFTDGGFLGFMNHEEEIESIVDRILNGETTIMVSDDITEEEVERALERRLN